MRYQIVAEKRGDLSSRKVWKYDFSPGGYARFAAKMARRYPTYVVYLEMI